jgi:hypothetical protein
MSIAADLVSGGASGLMSGLGTLMQDIRSAWTGEPTIEKQAEIEQRLIELDYAITKAQTDINLEEAKHPNIFISGWRPFIGWVCGAAITYNFILNPLTIWILKLNHIEIMPPPIDTGSLYPLIMSLLGLGGMRTYEKFKNVNGKH